MKFVQVVFLALGLAFAGSSALAQPYRAGTQVEYRAQSWPETWVVGTYVRDLPGGTQAVIRERPTQFFPEGFERAYTLATEVRPVAAQAAAQAAQPAQAAAAPAMAQPGPAPARADAAANAAGPPDRGVGLMSQADVLGFLSARLGAGDPFMNPQREPVLAALRAEVLRRGVDFHYQAVGDFSNRLGRYGALSNVTFAIGSNFGAPAAQADLMGAWRLTQVGATTGRGNLRFGLAGSLTIGPDGRYAWDSPSGPLHGGWRPATAAEMEASDKGGQGVVLIAAKNGVDWLVHRRREEGPEGDGIMVRDLATRNLRERGVR